MPATDHFRDIYAHHADRYDELVACEDYAGALLPALRACAPLTAQTRVVEMGAGTGRLTRLIGPVVGAVVALDFSPAMLAVAGRRLGELKGRNWRIAAAENRHLPVARHWADVCLAGWSLGHAVGWYPDDWQAHIAQAIEEMRRVVRPGGTAILIETLGTGNETPAPPTPALAEYYDFLERIAGFRRAWIRTDYRFESVQKAEALTRFFFGDALADRVRREGWVVVPECTGVWHWRVP